MFCLLCDEPIYDQEVVVIKQGGIRHRRWGVEFRPSLFDDDTPKKYIHLECAREHGVAIPLLEEGHCTLCNIEFEPDEPGHASDCVIQVSRGVLQPSNKRGPTLVFIPCDHGNVHYTCACDEWNFPLMSRQGDV